MRCHIYELDKFVGELSIKEFLREYNSLKQRYNKKQNLKIWDVLNQKKQGKAHFYFSSQKDSSTKDEKHDDNGNLLNWEIIG